jgi:hypothetical protein
MDELRRRCCVQPPDLAITDFDPTDRVSDLHNRIGHALHFSGETVPLGQKAFVFRSHAAVCFERFQDVDHTQIALLILIILASSMPSESDGPAVIQNDPPHHLESH